MAYNRELSQFASFIEVGISSIGITTSVGIGITNPTQSLHIQGNARVTGAIYDSTNLPGTSGQILQSTGTGTQWTTQGTLNVSYADNAGIATNLKGGIASQIPYQTAANTTAFIPNGTSGQLLQSNGTSAPSWVNPTGLSVNYADNAGIATNIKGGAAGSIPYQSGANTTTFVAVGAAGSILQSDGSKPVWVSQSSVVPSYASSIAVSADTTNITRYIPFVDITSGLTTVRTDSNITYNPSTDILALTNLTVSGVSTFGDATTDRVTFNAQINSNVLPSTNGTLDLGGTSNKWNNIYANNFVGTITGNADTATKLANARNIAITGDLAWNVNFDGSANVSSGATLANTGVIAGTYGSSTQVGILTVDAKGRVTAASNVNIAFNTATVAKADSLTTGRTISITGDLSYTSPAFDGTANVTATGTLANTGVVAGTYGSTTTVGILTVDAKGRVTAASNVPINFSAATVAQADKIATISTSTNASFYPTFVDANNATVTYESVYTDAGISYNPSTDVLALTNLTTSGVSTFNGNVTFGDATTDTVSFTSRVGTGITPSTNGTLDLGGTSNKWNNIYANNFVGTITGNADTATKLQTARNIAITGDLTWNVNFDGSANVTSTGTLANSGVSAGTYGSSTAVPIVTVDAKGRVTSVSTIGVNFSTATVAQADKLTSGRTISISGDLSYTSPAFDGTGNVTAVGTLANSGVSAGTYGSSTQVGILTVDAKGRITAASNIPINFSTATVAQSDKVATISNTTNSTFYPTFVDSNNGTAAYENVYTDSGITYNPSSNALNVNGNLFLGLTDTASGEITSTGGSDANFGIFNDHSAGGIPDIYTRKTTFITRNYSNNNQVERFSISEGKVSTSSGTRLISSGSLEVTTDGMPVTSADIPGVDGSRLSFYVRNDSGAGSGDIFSHGGTDGLWGLYNTSGVVGRMIALAIANEALDGYDAILRAYRNGVNGQRTVDCPYPGTLFAVNGSKSFKINHPIDETKDLVHVSVEGPRADLLYRGSIKLKNGTATVNLDQEYGLIPGTWKALCRNPQVWVTSADGWEPCRGSVTDEILTIQSKDSNCTETVNWLVVAERQDAAMYNQGSDENGRPILEPDKVDFGSDHLPNTDLQPPS